MANPLDVMKCAVTPTKGSLPNVSLICLLDCFHPLDQGSPRHLFLPFCMILEASKHYIHFSNSLGAIYVEMLGSRRPGYATPSPGMVWIGMEGGQDQLLGLGIELWHKGWI